MTLVNQGLGIGHIVDGGHAAMLDADLLVHNLDHRRQAIGGAGSGCQQVMFLRPIEIIIHPHHHIQCPFNRRGNDDFFHPLIKIGLQLCGLTKPARAFKDNVTIRPVCIRNGAVRAIGDLLSVDHHCTLLRATLWRPDPVHRVEFEQMCRHCRIAGNLIYPYKVYFWPALRHAHTQPAHATKAVYSNCRHIFGSRSLLSRHVDTLPV